MPYYASLRDAIEYSYIVLRQNGAEVDTGHWQGVSTEGRPELVTREIMGLKFDAPIPPTHADLIRECDPNIPWAEDHFLERVSRVPSNPGEQYKNWPWWKGQEGTTAIKSERYADHQGDDFQFTHTYQERFWPRWAGWTGFDESGNEVQVHKSEFASEPPNKGVRYEYGDLDDVVHLLHREPTTRQATFPIFFPEDTGAVHGGRIPCTLHYHFLMRNHKLNMWYPIRSCDAVRHFRDDIYMAGRLNQWVIEELRKLNPELWDLVEPGTLHFEAYSFHVHKGDEHLL